MATRPHRFSRALVLVATVVLTAPIIDGHVASATSVDDQRREVERIVDQLDDLHEQADILAEDYAVAVDEKNQLDIEIAKAEERVAAKQAELTTLQGDLAEVAVRTFTGAGADVLGPLFSDASTYSAGLRRDQYSRVALNVGTGTTDDLDELIGDLADEQQDLEDKRDRAKQLTEEIADKQQQVEQLTAQYIDERAAAEARLGDLIAEEEARRDAEALAEIQRQAQQASAGGGGGGGSDNSSERWRWRRWRQRQRRPDLRWRRWRWRRDRQQRRWRRWRIRQRRRWRRLLRPGLRSGGHGDQCRDGPDRRAVPLRDVRSGRRVRLLGAHPLRLGSGRRLPATQLTLPRRRRLPHVPAGDAQPGDLIFYYTPISHVGIYLGGGQLVHAPNTGRTVSVTSVNWSKVTAVGRPG